MKSALLFLSVLAVAFGYYAPLLNEGKGIRGQYIVVYHENATDAQREGQFLSLGSNGRSSFDIGPSFRGFSATLTPELLDKVRAAPYVKYVEEDQIVNAFDFEERQSCIKQADAPWGLTRITQDEIDLDDTFPYKSVAGSGIDAFIVDTGILISHSEFGSRATWGGNFIDKTNTDCNGHGTHVAGTVGGTTFGVAKSVNLIAVKVLDCKGSGTLASIIDGLNFCGQQKDSRKRPAVLNMSLGGGFSSTINSAVDALVKNKGIVVVCAAGNENQDACNVSPASSGASITVGATDVDEEGTHAQDVRTSFSNYGQCVHIFAPGLAIKSAYIGTPDNRATRDLSGTSMAAPHVAGVAALYMSISGESDPGRVKSYLVNNGLTGKIEFMCTTGGSKCSVSSPNVFLYFPCA